MSGKRRSWIGAAILAALLMIGTFAWPAYRHHSATEYRRFDSPDGRYRLVVYKYPSLVSGMPGQSGDSSGYMQLKDASGQVLQECAVDMVSMAEEANWQPASVSVRMLADWPLP